MSAMKNYLVNQIDALSTASGYSTTFLLNMWNECMNNGDSWDYFWRVTLERDW